MDYNLWYAMTEHCIAISYHAIENVAANTTSASYERSTMGRLDVILSKIQWLSCIPIGMVWHGIKVFVCEM